MGCDVRVQTQGNISSRVTYNRVMKGGSDDVLAEGIECGDVVCSDRPWLAARDS